MNINIIKNTLTPFECYLVKEIISILSSHDSINACFAHLIALIDIDTNLKVIYPSDGVNNYMFVYTKNNKMKFHITVNN